MSVNRTSLGKRISFYRSKSNLTQEALAAKVNCSREYIWPKLKKAQNTPSVATLVEIADTLCISVDEFVARQSCTIPSSTLPTPNCTVLLLDCNETEQDNHYPHGKGVKGHSCQPWNLTSIRIKITK